MLKKCFRLRKNRDFKAVYEEKRSVAAGVVVLYVKEGRAGTLPRIGFSVSKKLGGAVIRNRCRRMLREAVRLHINEIRPEMDYAFIGRHSLVHADFLTVEKDVLYALKRSHCIY